MNNITKIQTVLDNAVIKQEFIGFIADVEFNDISVYKTVLSLLEEINNKFKTLLMPLLNTIRMCISSSIHA